MSDLSNSGFVPLSQFASVGSLSALGAGGWGPRYPARARWQAPAAESDRGRSAPGPADPVGEGRGAGGSPAAEGSGVAPPERSEVLNGTVANVTSFGLFVDVGVADGLVHRSEITWDKGLERHRGFDPRQRHRVPSSGIPDRGSTSGGSCACPCGGYRRRTAAFVALDTSSLSKCHVRNADSQVMRTYNRNQMTPGPIYL